MLVQIPQRGLSACTYIAAVAALRLVIRGEIPDSANWADCINRGVQAFHEARVSAPRPWSNNLICSRQAQLTSKVVQTSLKCFHLCNPPWGSQNVPMW